MGPMPQYAALVDDHVGSCEGSLVGEERSTVPRRGALPPPFGGYRQSLPLPPRGRGRRPKAGRGRGAALQSITSEWGRKITHLYNLGCFNSMLFTHMRVNRFFSGKMFIMVGVLLSTTV